MDEIDRDAKIIWDYMLMRHVLQSADAIFVLCSFDIRVAERAADLYSSGLGRFVIVSGGIGPTTDSRFTTSEAEIFANILKSRGVPIERIIIEDKSTNTGENITFTYHLLRASGRHFKSFILVQKPYMERRTYATFRKQWPDSSTEFSITSPQIAYEDYFDVHNPKSRVLNTLVGDMQRIREYPAKGFQIPQEIPAEVWQAYEQLVAAGFTRHLIS